MRALLIVSFALAGILAYGSWSGMRIEKDAPPIGAFIEVEGERLHVVDIPAADGGTLPPVLLIHGASVNLREMKIALGEALNAWGRQNVRAAL